MRALSACLLLGTSLFAQEAQPLPEGASLDIVVQEVRGEVEVQTAPKTKWIVPTNGLKLSPGAKLCTGVDGQAVVTFGANSVAIVTEASMFEIRSFGMKGDELVAEAFIDPGVAHVSVKQLEQFQTDFQVSTPRLTCSVRGSAYTIWSNGGAGMLDSMRCDEHLAEVILANLQQWMIATGAIKVSGSDSPEETRTRTSTTDVTPQGSTASEQVARLVLLIAHTLAIDPGSLTLGANRSPAGGDLDRLQEFVQEHCSPEDIQRYLAILRDSGHETIAGFLETGNLELLGDAQGKLDDINEGRGEDANLQAAYAAYVELRHCLAAAQLLEDRQGITTRAEGALLFTTIDNLDVFEHLARDADTDFQGGIDGEVKEGMFQFARRNGFPRFANEVFLPYIDDRFLEDPDGLLQSDPQLFVERRADFLNDGSGFSFNDLDGILALADQQAHSPVAEDTMARLLLGMLNAGYYIISYSLPEVGELEQNSYDEERQHFEDETFDPLNTFRQQGDYDHFLATYAQSLIEAYEDRTDCDGDPDPEDPCFEAENHYTQRLLDVLRGFRGATGHGPGFQTSQEFHAMGAFVGLSDIRHHIEPEDVTDFQLSHDRRQVELEAFHLVGLSAGVDVFSAQDILKDFENNISFLQSSEPLEHQRRLDVFHEGNHGFDAYLNDWHAVQDEAREGPVQTDTLGNAIIDSVNMSWFRQNGGLPTGDLSSGQFEFERQDFLANAIQPLENALGTDFNQFKQVLAAGAEQAWHDATGVSNDPDPSPGETGFDAHEHFHQALDQLLDDIDAATEEGGGGA